MVVCDKQIDISLRTLDYFFFFFPPHYWFSCSLAKPYGVSAICISSLLMKSYVLNSLKKKPRTFMVNFLPPRFRFDAVLVLVVYIIKCTYEHVNFMVLIFFNGTVGFGNNKRV